MLGSGKPPTWGRGEKRIWLPRDGTSRTPIVQGICGSFRFISRRIKESKSRRHVSTTPVRCTSLGVTGANPEVTCELGVLAALAGFRNWGAGEWRRPPSRREDCSEREGSVHLLCGVMQLWEGDGMLLAQSRVPCYKQHSKDGVEINNWADLGRVEVQRQEKAKPSPNFVTSCRCLCLNSQALNARGPNTLSGPGLASTPLPRP